MLINKTVNKRNAKYVKDINKGQTINSYLSRSPLYYSGVNPFGCYKELKSFTGIVPAFCPYI